MTRRLLNPIHLCAAALVFIHGTVPETKGRGLEEIEAERAAR